MAILTPMRHRFWDNAGLPLSGGKVYTYLPGTTTPVATYTDSTGLVANTNPIILDSKGEANIWSVGLLKVNVTDSVGVQITGWPVDNIGGSDNPFIIDNVAVLRSLSPPYGYSSIIIKGYYTPGDGGGQTLYWDNTSVLADNGGTVFLPTGYVGTGRWRSVSSEVNVKQFGAVGDGVHDDTAAIQAAISSFPLQGTPTWTPWTLSLPSGTYKVTSTISINNQQGSRVTGGNSATITGNFNGPLVQFGLNAGNLGNIWSSLDGLILIQTNTGPLSKALSMEACYTCYISNCRVYGGYNCLTLQGNNNLFSSVSFRGATSSGVVTGSGANNEVNTFLQCAFEICGGYGIEIATTTSYGGHYSLLSCYWEQATLGCVYIKNTEVVSIKDCFMNIAGSKGVVLDGTIGASYPSPMVSVKGNRVFSDVSGTAAFIHEVSSTSVNCAYGGNILESGGSCNMYGQAPQSINIDRLRKRPYLTNSDTFAPSGSVPTGWTIATGGGVTTTAGSFSPYGSGASVQITPTNSYIWQQVSVPSGSLIRISCYAASVVAGSTAALQIWSAGLGVMLASAATTATVATKLEIYLTSTARSGATSFILMLRNSSGTQNVEFCDIDLEDMSV